MSNESSTDKSTDTSTDTSTESLIDLIFQLKGSCMNSEAEIISETGVSQAEYHGLEVLKPNERIGGLELAQKMNLSASRASRILENMVQNNLVIREIDKNDRRRCTIQLDQKGLDIKEKIKTQKMKCEEHIRQKLSDEEIQKATASLNKLLAIM